jgi:nitrogen regulatory protein PII
MHDKFHKMMGKWGHMSMHGHGSADSKVLEYLGLGDNRKVVSMFFVGNDHVKEAYKFLNKELNLRRAGAGIAFAVPVSGASAALKHFKSDMFNENKPLPEKKETIMEYDLIITIVNRGSFDKVKNAARAMGARGGTLLHGLGMGGEEAAKFLGIQLQPEKDVIFVVVKKDEAKKVMAGIVKEAGIMTESGGICFSLPVESAFGLAGADGDEI